MTKKLYLFKCSDCNKEFRTDDPDKRICPTCQKYRQPHKKHRIKKRKKKILTFSEISHLIDVFYKVNHKYLHYGDMVNLIDSHRESCVCCGATIPEGKQICSKCERMAK